MALDEMIMKSKRENSKKNGNNFMNRRNRRGNNRERKNMNRGRGSFYSHNSDRNGQWKHDKYEASNINDRLGNNREKSNNQSNNRNNRRSNTITITNLHWEVSENDLRTVFENIGEIVNVRIKYDISGRSEGEATVTFSSSEEAEKAINEYDGIELNGENISIKLKENTNNNNKNGGGRNRNVFLKSNRNNNGGINKNRGGSVFSRIGKTNEVGSNRGRNNSSNQNKFKNRSNTNGKKNINLSQELLDNELDKYMNETLDTNNASTINTNTTTTATITMNTATAPINTMTTTNIIKNENSSIPNSASVDMSKDIINQTTMAPTTTINLSTSMTNTTNPVIGSNNVSNDTDVEMKD